MQPHEQRFKKTFDKHAGQAIRLQPNFDKPEIRFARNVTDYGFQTSGLLGKLSYFLLPKEERIRGALREEKKLKKELKGRVLVWVDKKGLKSWVYVHPEASQDAMNEKAKKLLEKAIFNQVIGGTRNT